MGRRENKKRARDTEERQGGEGEVKKSDGRSNKWVDMEDPASFVNEAFERHYKHQLAYCLGSDEQWKEFHSILTTNLPSSARFNASLPAPVLAHVKKMIMTEFAAAESTPKVLEWVEGGNAFQVPLSRGELKRSKENKRVKKVSTALNDCGFMSRQEAVSMIPALFLDAQPGDTVADLCAAPGSKTTQILERLVAGGTGVGGGGCMVANDVNAGRLDVLNHQTGRIAGAQSRLVITKHDATRFPLSEERLFDRVLCDVMCSGDGTLRKSMDLWGRWTPNDGPALHNSQCQVLLRGMSLVKEGGTVVYSTCSMNPIEDEAVIAKCLLHAKGAFELIDLSDKFPLLKREKGIYSWSVMSKDAKETYATVEEAKEKSERFKKYTETMWPPPLEVAKGLNLERCARLLPQAQDTGGFFIAALRCVKPFSTNVNFKKIDISATNVMKPLTEEGKATLQRVFGFKDEESFPYDQIYSRGEDTRLPKFYFVQPGTKATLEKIADKGYNVEQAGEKVFDCATKKNMDSLRFVSEGCGLLATILPKRFVRQVDFAKVSLFMSPGQDGRVSWTSWLETLVERNEEIPPRHFIVQTTVPGLGVMTFAAATSAFGSDVNSTSIKVRVTDPQQLLIRHALGEDIVGGGGDGEAEAEPAAAGADEPGAE